MRGDGLRARALCRECDCFLCTLNGIARWKYPFTKTRFEAREIVEVLSGPEYDMNVLSLEPKTPGEKTTYAKRRKNSQDLTCMALVSLPAAGIPFCFSERLHEVIVNKGSHRQGMALVYAI